MSEPAPFPLLLLLWLCAPHAAAADESGAAGSGSAQALSPVLALSLPAATELVAAKAHIGKIEVEVGNIFDADDPQEDRRLFHWVNALHRLTRPQIVLDRLLFAEGDVFDPARLAESERLLRDARYFYDVDIHPTAWDREKNEVTVKVQVRDVWTLKGGVKIGRSGGESSFGFGLQDDNFLGSGKSVKIDRRQNVDRNSTIFHYFDPSLGGSRWQLLTEAERNSDGNVYSANLEHPFYALDTRRAFGLRLRQEEQAIPLYELGEITNRFSRSRDHAEIYFGLSSGLRGKRVWRWLGGLTYEDATFAEIPGEDPGTLLPRSRHLIYPFIGFSTAEDRFAETRNFDQIARTEDLQLGLAASFSLGFASEALGSDRDALVLEGLASGGFEIGRSQILLYEMALGGRFGRDGGEDVLLSGSLRYHRRNFGRHLFVLEAQGALSDNLDRDHQILLGGDNGLRGYPLRYQSGESRFLLTGEQRFYTDWYPFRLFNVGAAAFFDIGRTFGHEPGSLFESRGWLSDVGIGLRLSSSRTHHGSMIHFDLAFPLDADNGIDSVQWLIRTKTSF